MSKRAMSCLLVTLAISQHAAAASGFSITYVTGKYSGAVALNEVGQVAINNHEAYIPSRGSITGPSGSIDFGTLGGPDSEVHGINDKGDAVGVSLTASGEWHGFLYAGGHMQDLTATRFPGNPSVINDRGDIAGTASDGAFLYHDGKLTSFGSVDSQVRDINESGDVVGYQFVGGHQRAFLYRDGKLTNLGTAAAPLDYANAINDAGEIVGISRFIYHGDTVTPFASPAANIEARDINNLGEVVGGINGRAFLYSGGAMTDLNTLLPPDSRIELVSGAAINDRHQILAEGCFTGNDAPSGCFSALLDPIPPVPEPTENAMLLAGGVALYAARRFRRQTTRQ